MSSEKLQLNCFFTVLFFGNQIKVRMFPITTSGDQSHGTHINYIVGIEKGNESPT